DPSRRSSVLDARDYYSASVILYNLMYFLTPVFTRGVLNMWIKGARGGEIAWVALVDDENRDGKKTVVRLPINDFGGITSEWRLLSVPLAKFGRRGVFWDAKKRIEVPSAFDWTAVTEFRIEIKKAENPSFRVWVDAVAVLRDVFEPAIEAPSEDWMDKEETIEAPPAYVGGGKVMHTFFRDELPAGAFTYVYGAKTAVKVQPGGKPGRGVLPAYMDGNEYSGITVALGEGKNIDLRGMRDAKGAIAFWAKGAPGVKQIYLGLLDSRPDGIKAQSKIVLGDYGKIDTNWNYFQVPLKRFMNTGLYWDAAKMGEIS